MNPITSLQDWASGKASVGKTRSSKWGSVRKEHLNLHPECACCGGKKNLNVHHKMPFHLAPELELEPLNLITLCEGGNNVNCHLVMGHLMNFKSYNQDVDFDVARWRKKIAERP